MNEMLSFTLTHICVLLAWNRNFVWLGAKSLSGSFSYIDLCHTENIYRLCVGDWNPDTLEEEVVDSTYSIPWRRAWHPLQSSCLENPMHRGAWRAAVHGVTESRTQLSGSHTRSTPYVWRTRTGIIREVGLWLPNWWWYETRTCILQLQVYCTSLLRSLFIIFFVCLLIYFWLGWVFIALWTCL